MYYIIFCRVKNVALFLAIRTYLHQLRTTTLYWRQSVFKPKKMWIPHIMPWDSFHTLLGFEHTCNCLCLCVCVCLRAYLCVYVCTYLISHRSEDHCWRFDPVGEEAVRCDDPHRVLPQCLCPHWSAALHGKSAAQVCHLAHQHHRNVPRYQWQPCIQLARVHHEWEWATI